MLDSDQSPFPPGFEVLAPFQGWALSTERARLRRRISTPFEETTAFYRAMTPLMREALDYLNAKSLDNLSGADLALMYLALAYAEAAFAVEMYCAPDSPHSVPVDDMLIVNDEHDFKPVVVSA